MAERERYDRRPKRRHNRDKVAYAPILAITARKPQKAVKAVPMKNRHSQFASTVDCAAFRKTRTNPRCLSGEKFPLKPLNKKTADAVKSERRLLLQKPKRITREITVTRKVQSLL